MYRYRVIQWGTGNTGTHALRFLADDQEFDVVGVWVGRQANVGRTVGEILGGEPHGPRATTDIDEILALEADCVIYMGAEPKGNIKKPGTEAWTSAESVCRLLESGKNVICVGISGLTNPRNYGPELFERLGAAAQSGNSTFFGTGIEPGFMCDAFALSLTSVSRNIRSIRAQEIISYATYDQPRHHVSQGGIWGAQVGSGFAESFPKFVLAAGMDAPVRLLAGALGVELDDVSASVEFAEAAWDFRVPMGEIVKGSIAGYRFEVVGHRKGREIIAVEHIPRLCEDVAPHWASLRPGGFRVLLEGSPSYEVTVVFREDDPNVAACTGTAARAVNAVATVCAAPAGVCSFLDLPMITAAGIVG